MSDETLDMINDNIAAARADLAKLSSLRGQIDRARDELRLAEEATMPKRAKQLQEGLWLLEIDYQHFEASARARLAQHQALREQYLQRQHG